MVSKESRYGPCLDSLLTRQSLYQGTAAAWQPAVCSSVTPAVLITVYIFLTL